MLDMLGVEDFGVYNVVGGVVALFAFLNSVMTSATQRFLSFDLGRNDYVQFGKTFSVSMSAHFCIVGVVVILSETLGLWFLNTLMDIPSGRMFAANVVYQIVIINFCLKIIRVPYTACVIAYERMAFFAWVSILEVLLSLVSVYVLMFVSADKLVLYATLVCFSSLIVLFLCKWYCNQKLYAARYSFVKDKALFKTIKSFSGWSMFGGMANLGSSQGINLLLNVFFGVTVNAAMAIANQVGSGVYSLVSGFSTAFNPQLVKLYAREEYDEFLKLIIRASKFSFFLIFIIALPCLLNMDYILNLWLPTVPEYTKEFSQLMILFFCIDAVSNSLWSSVQATGNIRRYQLIISSVIFLSLPISYVFLRMGFSPVIVMVVKVAVNFLAHAVRIGMLKKMIRLPVKKYLYQTMLIPAAVVALSVPLPLLASVYMDGVQAFLLSSALSVAIVALCGYFIGMNAGEREFVKNLIKNRIHAR
jgi:O-antigen/teichoic acid export membrane protein